MAGIMALEQLLKTLSPQLQAGDYVFCTLAGRYGDFAGLSPLASFQEAEGLTLVLAAEQAERAGLAYQGLFRLITLSVHSSLEAVGLTAAVATCLTEQGISANVIAAYYHDYILVPKVRAQDALAALKALAAGA